MKYCLGHKEAQFNQRWSDLLEVMHLIKILKLFVPEAGRSKWWKATDHLLENDYWIFISVLQLPCKVNFLLHEKDILEQMICHDSVYRCKSNNGKVTNARGKGKSEIHKLLQWHKYHKWYFKSEKDILKQGVENTD